MTFEYVERVMHEAGRAASERGQHGLAYRFHHPTAGLHGPADFLSIFGVPNWSPSTAVPGSYRAGSWHNCVLARSPWTAAVVLASVESERPTEELLALASVLLSTGEVEFMCRAPLRGEGSP